MQDLGSARSCAGLMRRCTCLTANSPAAWGRMSAPQMVVHVSDAFRMALQDARSPVPSGAAIPSKFNSRLGRRLALTSPFAWPKGIPTVPQLDALANGNPPPELFEQYLADLLALLRRFSTTPAPDLLPAHPFLGPLTHTEWMRWGYLHTDHHLRQFRC